MYVQAGLSAREDRESSINCCGAPMRLVQAFLCAERPDNAVFSPEEVL